MMCDRYKVPGRCTAAIVSATLQDVILIHKGDTSMRKRKVENSIKKIKDKNKKKWNPCNSDRLCSMHFVDGTPTIANPDPTLNTLRYWRNPKHVQNTSKSKRKFKSTKYRKLSHRDKFFLTLTRLRLGILNEDIAERFGISPTTSSNIFTTWIKLISSVLGSALVVWLLRESIRENLPRVFKNAGYYKCCVIIDCAEVFIERPKSLLAQASTWSDDKQHNMFKFFV
ncbi:uncharacterized protein LOC136094187 [Hydra vulgaris]|uniref:uncharacterized protein LOC136094187 n=1 Tax=Hydra vulgaris TaxID=6087 RepID=UPI0032EA4440